MTDLVSPKHLRDIYARHAFGVKFGLDAMESVLELLGHPERGLCFIHVAGTNGKGSVCAMLESVLRTAGLRTGLYTSPHLICFHERIKVNGRAISDADLACAFEELAAATAKYETSPAGRQLTFFEYATLLALVHFKEVRPDVIIWETGMGGRLDATNVVRPALSVITGIAMDHATHLGASLAAIASEKAGIIKQGVPVVLGPLLDEAHAVLLRAAHERGCRALDAGAFVTIRSGKRSWQGQVLSVDTEDESLGSVRLPLLGRHQAENTAVAVAALSEFGRIMGVDWPSAILKKGLQDVSWPGRLQALSEEPLMLVDGAHNPEAAEGLALSLRDLSGKRPLGFILGVCRDKDVNAFLDTFFGMLNRTTERCWAVRINNERSMEAEELAKAIAARGLRVSANSLTEAWAEARRWAADTSGIACAAGSLFLAGEILEREGWGARLGCPYATP